MRFEFTIKPYQACMDVKVMCDREEIKQDYFFLNRDFTFNHCFLDGETYDISANTELVSLTKICDGYKVNKCTIPRSFHKIEMEYTGYLNGESGGWPYVCETISPEYALLRFETFCYPVYCDDDMHSLIGFLNACADIDLLVVVPNEFIAVSDGIEVRIFRTNRMTTYEFKSDIFGFNVAIAKFIINNLSFGKFYLLGEIDSMIPLQKVTIR